MIDQFGRSITYLRLSLTPHCNLNCIYCRPGTCPGGIDPFGGISVLTPDEIDRLAGVFAQLGINRIRLTGGEPLLRTDLEVIIQRIRRHTDIIDLSLTTNGQDLANRAASLKQAGLNRINISLDSLQESRFKTITGQGSLQRVLDGIDACLAVGLTPVKLNTVLMRGINDDELDNLFKLTLDRPLALRLIELMPMNDTASDPDRLITGTEILSRYPQLSRVKDTYPGQPAQDYRLPGHIGTIGLIRPISHRFCAVCNRIRVTAEGRIKGCLGQDDEFDLRPWLDQPDDARLLTQVAGAILHKPIGHTFQTGQAPARSMDRTGG